MDTRTKHLLNTRLQTDLICFIHILLPISRFHTFGPPYIAVRTALVLLRDVTGVTETYLLCHGLAMGMFQRRSLAMAVSTGFRIQACHISRFRIMAMEK
jgi:hypothetical protein